MEDSRSSHTRKLSRPAPEHRTFKQRWNNPSATTRYGYIFLIVLSELLVSSSIPEGSTQVWALAYLIILPSIIVRLAGCPRRYTVVSLFIVIVGFSVAAILQFVGSAHFVNIAYSFTQLAVQLFIAWIIVRGLLRRDLTRAHALCD